jgi:hypothetical protein
MLIGSMRTKQRQSSSSPPRLLLPASLRFLLETLSGVHTEKEQRKMNNSKGV